MCEKCMPEHSQEKKLLLWFFVNKHYAIRKSVLSFRFSGIVFILRKEMVEKSAQKNMSSYFICLLFWGIIIHNYKCTFLWIKYVNKWIYYWTVLVREARNMFCFYFNSTPMSFALSLKKDYLQTILKRWFHVLVEKKGKVHTFVSINIYLHNFSSTFM